MQCTIFQNGRVLMKVKCPLLSFCRYIDDFFTAMLKQFSVKNFLYFPDKSPYGGLYPPYLKESNGKITQMPLGLIGEEGGQVACLDLHPSTHTPGSDEHGPWFLTGVRGRRPGVWLRRTGLRHMRVRGESISYSRECLCVRLS